MGAPLVMTHVSETKKIAVRLAVSPALTMSQRAVTLVHFAPPMTLVYLSASVWEIVVQATGEEVAAGMAMEEEEEEEEEARILRPPPYPHPLPSSQRQLLSAGLPRTLAPLPRDSAPLPSQLVLVVLHLWAFRARAWLHFLVPLPQTREARVGMRGAGPCQALSLPSSLLCCWCLEWAHSLW